mmetsp:Transcript_25119/g.36775  ORF Transcript_25119/g.36775 Transcript_25119/m.36775 type:complete len:270 (-) Transcript_25119:1489-2298(-)
MSHHLHKLKHERFHACRRGANHSLAVACFAQLQVKIPGNSGSSVECERKHGFTNHRSELLSHHASREVKKGVRHNLCHQRFSIGQHERQQRCHNCGFSSAHNHLMAHRPVVSERVHKLVDENDLTLAKHDGIGKLEDQVPRIEFNKGRVRCVHFHKVPLSSDVGCNLTRLQLDLLYDPDSFLWFVRCFHASHQTHQFRQTRQSTICLSNSDGSKHCNNRQACNSLVCNARHVWIQRTNVMFGSRRQNRGDKKFEPNRRFFLAALAKTET